MVGLAVEEEEEPVAPYQEAVQKQVEDRSGYGRDLALHSSPSGKETWDVAWVFDEAAPGPSCGPKAGWAGVKDAVGHGYHVGRINEEAATKAEEVANFAYRQAAESSHVAVVRFEEVGEVVLEREEVLTEAGLALPTVQVVHSVRQQLLDSGEAGHPVEEVHHFGWHQHRIGHFVVAAGVP